MFFCDKIEKLQENIDVSLSENPTERMKSKWNSKKDSKKFNLKTINEEITLKTIKRMHRKKTACSDGLTQELLKLGSSALAAPLTAIINKSILTSIYCHKGPLCAN